MAFAVVVASFHARSIFMTDGGDNLILLMAFYLVLTACGRRWSLDARGIGRRATTAAETACDAESLSGQLRYSRETLTAVLHNCGMFVIAAQVCFLYGSAGLYKAQGGTWGNGTALRPGARAREGPERDQFCRDRLSPHDLTMPRPDAPGAAW